MIVSSVGHHVRSPHALRHQLVQRFHQVRHVAAPDRLRGARDLEPLPLEDVFQPVQRQVIGELTRYDVSQQSRSGQPLVDCGSGFAAVSDLRAGAVAFARRAGVLLAQVLDALEVAGIVFDLPALVRADLLALGSAARAGALFRAQFVDVRGDGEVLEVGEIAPALAPPHAPQFL